MDKLKLSPNFTDGDGFYERLLSVFESLEDSEDIQALSARLILILSNHIGDNDVLYAALEAATLNAPE